MDELSDNLLIHFFRQTRTLKFPFTLLGGKKEPARDSFFNYPILPKADYQSFSVAQFAGLDASNTPVPAAQYQ